MVAGIPILMKHPWDSNQNIRVLYSGETADGIPNGLGEFTWDIDDPGFFTRMIYSSTPNRGFGKFSEGQLYGQALVIFKDGRRGSGKYIQGVRSEYGTTYYPIGDKMKDVDISGWAEYYGEFKDRKKHGKGAAYNKEDGSVFIGEYDNHQRKSGFVSRLKEDNTRAMYSFSF